MGDEPTTDRGRNRVRGAGLTLIRRTHAGTIASRAWSALPEARVDDRSQGICLRRLPARDLAVVAHFDAAGQVDPTVRHLLDALSRSGFAVVLVSTAPASVQELADQADGLCSAVVRRDNVGFDFLSWKRGLQFAAGQHLLGRRLVLVNTSMHGPLFDWEPVISRHADLPVWGMTESVEFRPHLQSWWLGFGPGWGRDPLLRRYFAQIRPATSKWETILTHELTWSHDIGAGRERAVVPFAAHRCRRNPLTFRWRDLIVDWGVPFVKKSLLTHNYDRIDLSGWDSFLARHSPAYDLGLIEAELD